jgi:hypothetical protein
MDFVSRYLYEFLAHNTIYQLRYGTVKTAKEILIVLATAAVVMMWEPAEYRRNCLTFLVRGPLSDDMRWRCKL